MYNTSANIKQSIHKLHMICYRFARGNYRFRKSCAAICKGVGKKVSQEDFFYACTKFHQRVIYNKKPKHIIEKLEIPSMCFTAKIGLKVYTKNKKFKNACINTIPHVLDTIQDQLRETKPSIFKGK